MVELSTTTLISLEVEENQKVSDFSQIDDFEGVYGNPFVKLLYVLCYILSLLTLPGFILVIWFERSGQAGQFRTLVNQLVSFCLDQVKFIQVYLYFHFSVS